MQVLGNVVMPVSTGLTAKTFGYARRIRTILTKAIRFMPIPNSANTIGRMIMEKLNAAQQVILDELSLSPASVVDIADRCKLSVTYSRIQIRILEEKGRVERVDSRTPYIYQVPKTDPLIKSKELIKNYQREFMDKELPTDPVGLFVRKIPKADWPALVDNLEAAIVAINALHTKGLLFDTLED
jgi:hypothetical protein